MQIEWTDEFTPFNPEYKDKFYSAEGGLAETQYVFLQQNNLRERFQKSEGFCIGELGFGTGLNFLATWKIWKETRSSDSQRLHYISCEKHPLSQLEIRRALQPWTEISDLSEKFLQKYSGPLPEGIHRLQFEDGVSLSLLIGDAYQKLKSVVSPRSVDAWFLDGFAPQRNPAMWSPEIFQTIRSLSGEDSTFSTYTSAVFVKRAMEANGFEVEKIKGFRRKREMLKGKLKSTPHTKKNSIPQSFVVVGAGLSGIAAAYALSKRGANVKIVDRAAEICSGASGNDIAIGAPVMTTLPSMQTRFSLAAFMFVQQLIQDFPNVFCQRGALQFSSRPKDLDRFERSLEWAKLDPSIAMMVNPQEASQIAGIDIAERALYFSNAVALKPRELCAEILKSRKSIQLELQSDFVGKHDGHSFLVLANSTEASELDHESAIPMNPNRGQIATLRSTHNSQKLKCTLMADKYISPQRNGYHCVGATYDRENLDIAIRPEENFDLRSMISKRFPSLSMETAEVVSSRVAFRSTTDDKLPWVGELHSGVYVSAGMGSRGLLYAFLSGEILASEIFGEPIPIERDIFEALRPYPV